MATTAYPLHWPAWVPRTEHHRITWSQFKVSDAQARDELFAELGRLDARDVIVSTNIPLRRDGRPYANPPKLTDAGVAVYFTRKGSEQCIACDRYYTPGENMRAIGKTIEALRGLERWGTSQMVDAAFRGFAALPETTGNGGWWTVLEVAHDAGREEIEAAHRRLVKVWHPDMPGGDTDRFQMVRDAYRQGLAASEGRQ